MTIDLLRAKRLVRSPYMQVDFNGRVEIDPNIVIYFLADMCVKEINGSIENAIKTIRTYLEIDISRLLDYKKAVRNFSPITEDLLIERISKSQTTKYLQRNLPKFSAQDYRGLMLRGNDGNIYKSVEIYDDADKYAWKLQDKKNVASSKKIK